MVYLIVIIATLLAVIVWQGILAWITAKQHCEHIGSVNEWQRERESEWAAERQQLLDRIQAPSFAEYKQAEIKQTKLQLGVKDPAPLEPL